MKKKRSNSWKQLERTAAKLLGGKRVTRGADFSKSMPDVDHDLFQIECKYRKNGFKSLYDYLEQAKGYDPKSLKLPLVVIQQKGKAPLAVLSLKHFGGLQGTLAHALEVIEELIKERYESVPELPEPVPGE